MICDNPTVGVLYDVTFQDCCVYGFFRARLASISYSADIDDDEPVDIAFDNGVIFTEHNVVHLTPVFPQ